MATASASDSNRTASTIAVGAATGLGAAILGYLATYLATSSTIENSTASQVLEALGQDISTWKVVGWVFMNAHGVVTTFPALFGGTSAVNLIENVDAFSAVLYVVPVVALVAAGALAVVVSGATTTKAGAIAGASTVVGYLPVAVAGIALFAITIGESVARPDPVTAILLAGAVYPALVGTLSGVATAALR
ncbi:transporter [Haloferax namakaokahaiae]|uniref:Transporter n=1 Tax=Haloferax namakaokahaiae TaxID=1748331 RepID=A0ABD5ZAU6_9EURY